MKGSIAEYRLNSFRGARALYARGIRHNFSRHAHESYIIGAVVRGCRILLADERRERISIGELFYLRPFQEHVCWSEGSREHDYVALALTAEQITDITESPYNNLVAAFNELFDLIGGEEIGSDLQRRIMKNLACLAGETLSLRTECIPGGINRGYAFIRDNYNLRLSLADIAEHSSMSKYNFQRNFTRYIGMSPAEAVAKERVSSALRRIHAGEAASSVALECGFADQSHLCRVVKKLTGVTLKNYSAVNKE